ncbi:HD domain-containing protein [Phyllobacterium salinisoli]|uniref:HD domain-containing protein n=1 Tax=Phyllobacterium salinisoli TaxID=1899321 RepID=A0A368K7Y3_9HYPH|nr:HD domain-containing protein [Phyllobacterium salinisoli]RCS24170.1 HD domain-containing protein [Phyllobacterium salinisoli]
MLASQFSPFEDLAMALLPHATDHTGDGSHDISHLCRVWKNAARIQVGEGGDVEVLVAATILHDCVSVEKNSPLRSQSSRLAADKASGILAALGWDQLRISMVHHAIEAHSFSAQIAPRTLEAKILQDADRLDAIGMVGVARCFYIAGRMGSALYDLEDPEARCRSYDDRNYAIDHFHTKLIKLTAGFQTKTGAGMAQVRHERLQRFLDAFMDEI